MTVSSTAKVDGFLAKARMALDGPEAADPAALRRELEEVKLQVRPRMPSTIIARELSCSLKGLALVGRRPPPAETPLPWPLPWPLRSTMPAGLRRWPSPGSSGRRGGFSRRLCCLALPTEMETARAGAGSGTGW